MKTVGIIGASGYTGGELLRLVINHPSLILYFVYSRTRPGTDVSETHPDLLGQVELKFTDKVKTDVDILFLCLGHGNSSTFLESHCFLDSTIIIDLSNDFRLKNDSRFQGREFIYGLPEINKDAIKKSKSIANPGCFATAIQLALLPLAKENKLNNTIHINATTGSTGAGVVSSPTSHFSWRNNNLSWYKPFTHQHLGEIEETLNQLQGKDTDILFLPQRGDFTRGIFVSSYTFFDGNLNDAFELYESFYKEEPFTQVSKKELHLKLVINSNQCFLHLHKHNDQLLITSIIDNLIKGASGQAIQNLNILMGWEEKLGLKLKTSIF
tara:strand:- start:19147 stop:20121 length:975 start_codon:yes stop_codon:yes gene_type:complete